MKFQARLHKIVKSDTSRFIDRCGNKVDSVVSNFSFEDEKEVQSIIKTAWEESLRGSLRYTYDLIGFGKQSVEVSYEPVGEDRFAVTVETSGAIYSRGSEFGASIDEAIAHIPDIM